jgi:hypothetical protein
MIKGLFIFESNGVYFIERAYLGDGLSRDPFLCERNERLSTNTTFAGLRTVDLDIKSWSSSWVAVANRIQDRRPLLRICFSTKRTWRVSFAWFSRGQDDHALLILLILDSDGMGASCDYLGQCRLVVFSVYAIPSGLHPSSYLLQPFIFNCKPSQIKPAPALLWATCLVDDDTYNWW